jgi:hypothetical protein
MLDVWRRVRCKPVRRCREGGVADWPWRICCGRATYRSQYQHLMGSSSMFMRPASTPLITRFGWVSAGTTSGFRIFWAATSRVLLPRPAKAWPISRLETQCSVPWMPKARMRKSSPSRLQLLRANPIHYLTCKPQRGQLTPDIRTGASVGACTSAGPFTLNRDHDRMTPPVRVTSRGELDRNLIAIFPHGGHR